MENTKEHSLSEMVAVTADSINAWLADKNPAGAGRTAAKYTEWHNEKRKTNFTVDEVKATDAWKATGIGSKTAKRSPVKKGLDISEKELATLNLLRNHNLPDLSEEEVLTLVYLHMLPDDRHSTHVNAIEKEAKAIQAQQKLADLYEALKENDPDGYAALMASKKKEKKHA
jgi:hypothetical protein